LTIADLAETDPTGLITRLENRLTQLEAAKGHTLADIDHARTEITHASTDLGKPFPHAHELTAAHERCRDIDEQLQAAAAPPQPPDNEYQAGGRAADEPEISPPSPSSANLQAAGSRERRFSPDTLAADHVIRRRSEIPGPRHGAAEALRRSEPESDHHVQDREACE
jgi:hypothetical protein